MGRLGRFFLLIGIIANYLSPTEERHLERQALLGRGVDGRSDERLCLRAARHWTRFQRAAPAAIRCNISVEVLPAGEAAGPFLGEGANAFPGVLRIKAADIGLGIEAIGDLAVR